MPDTKRLLAQKYERISEENEYIRIYDNVSLEEVVNYLYKRGVTVSEIATAKIGLEEYYIDLMGGEVKR